MNEIYLYGTVGSSFWDEDYFSETSVLEALEGKSGPLKVRINSGGGIASIGQAIYSLLRDYDGHVEVIIDGIAASAASLIAMAGDTITMPLGSTLMIHDPANPWTDGRGTEQDHLNAAKGLRVVSNAYAAIYAKRSGMTVEEARTVMSEETYYDGTMAVEAGFADALDEDTEAAAVARFDYRMYRKAPQELRKSSANMGTVTSRTAIMALMAGASAPLSKETTMENEDDEAQMTTDAQAEDDAAASTAAADEDDQTEAAENELDDSEEDGEETASSTLSTAEQIRDLCAASNRPDAEALDMVVRGLTVAQAVAEITASRQKENPMSGQRQGAPRAAIMRDERATRRTGMVQAIAAQLTGANEVQQVARPFMNLSLAEMAAQCIGHTGPMRNAGQRAQVFMDASHSTSDFPAIFENALNKVLLERYQQAEPTYRQIARLRNFNDFRVHPMVRAGDFPTLKPVGQNGEIKMGTFGEERETAILAPYAVQIRISRQMMVNDELGAIDEVLGDYGIAVADFEEQNFYAFALDASLSDGTKLFHADRNNLASSGSKITVASVSAGRAAMRKQTSVDKRRLNLSPSILLVGPNKETEAEQLVAAIQPQQSGNVNPFSGKLEVVVTAQITNNNWYLLAGAGRPGGACWTYGFLEGAAAPRLRTEDAFGQQGMAMSLEHDFGTGAVDYRPGYKNPGAA